MSPVTSTQVVVAWLRLGLRRRWRSLAVLAVLVALATGTVLAAVAGARRATSALARLQARTLPATAAMLPNTPNFDWHRIEALPEVAALTTFEVRYSFYFDGIPHTIGLGGATLDTTLKGAYPPADDAVMSSIEKPVVFSGRVFDPSRDDEMVISRRFAANFHRGVGDTLVLHLPSPQEVRDGLDGTSDRLTGPTLRMRIVGVVASPWFADTPDSPGNVILSPGVIAKHPANTVGDPTNHDNPNVLNALVRLRGGQASLPRFTADVRRVTGRTDLDIWNLPQQWRPEQHQIVFESRSLLAFGAAALAAALLLVGQAIVRYIAADTAELTTLRALGLAPRQAVACAVAAPALAGVVGGSAGLVAAGIASRWFPIGTAALLEPNPGMSWDWLVLIPGVAIIVVLVTGGSVLASWYQQGAARRQVRAVRSAIAVAAARAGLAVPLVVGARFALEADRGRIAVPVRPALVGGVIGVAGIVAAFTFSHGISDATDNPQRFGQTFQIGGFIGINGQDYFPSARVLAAISASTDVTGVDDARISVATGPAGTGSVALVSYTSDPKPLPTVVISGRMPQSPTEVLLAPRSLQALHVRIGGRIRLTGTRSASTLTVTGSGLLPQGPHNAYADGGWLTPEGYTALFTGFKYHFQLVALRPGANAKQAAASIRARVAATVPEAQGFSLDSPTPVAEVSELRQVRVLPVILGIFLALLAVGAVGHALATAVRRRSRDLAVLRALGMTRWQTRWVVVTQAVILALVGLGLGVPLGLSLGRLVWRVVADYTPILYVPPSAGWALTLIGPAVLLIAIALAAWPGQRAAHLRIATILRAE